MKEPSDDMLAVLVANGSAESIDALVPHFNNENLELWKAATYAREARPRSMRCSRSVDRGEGCVSSSQLLCREQLRTDRAELLLSDLLRLSDELGLAIDGAHARKLDRTDAASLGRDDLRERAGAP